MGVSAADSQLAPSWLIPSALTRPLVRGSVGVVLGTLFLGALLLWVRRAVGAASTPIPPAVLGCVGLALAALAVGARLAWSCTLPSSRSTFAVSAVVSLSAIGFAAAASLPNSSAAGLVALWGVVAGEELWSWWPRRRKRIGDAQPPVRRGAARMAEASGQVHFEDAVADSSPDQDLIPEHVTQQLTRVLEPDGTDRVVGWMRVSFEAGQRLASVHLAFCPPFVGTPQASLNCLEGPKVRIKPVQVFPFGARFDLKLSLPAEQRLDVLLQVAAELTGDEREEEIWNESS